jgi:hypothetical protein
MVGTAQDAPLPTLQILLELAVRYFVSSANAPFQSSGGGFF